MQSGSPAGPLFVCSIDASLVAHDVVERSHDGVEILEKEAVPFGLAQTELREVHFY